MFYRWYIKGKKSLWACPYCCWFACCWRWPDMGIIQGLWASHSHHNWWNWSRGVSACLDVFFILASCFWHNCDESHTCPALLLQPVWTIACPCWFFFIIFLIHSMLTNSIMLISSYGRQGRSRSNELEICFIDSCLFPLLTWKQLLLHTRLGK